MSAVAGSRRWTAAAALLVGLAVAGCGEAIEPLAPPASEAPPVLRALVPIPIAGIEGDGALGDGLPDGNGGIRRQEFRFAAGPDLSGFVDMTDYSVRRADGTPAEMHVGPDVPGTAILAFVHRSAACVEFAGIGRLDTDETKEFRIEACDNGTPGVGLDVFGVSIPTRPYFKGPDMLSEGEITRVSDAP